MRRLKGASFLAPAAVVMAMLVLAGPAGAATIPVQVAVGGGTRTLSLRTLSGADLTSVTMPRSGTAGFVANVTDVAYTPSGYQVTSNMSNLYAVSGATLDCAKSIPSSALSMGFATSPISLSSLSAIADPVFDATGSLTGALGLLLGVAGGTPITVSNVSAESVTSALAGVFSGLESTLPVNVSSGTPGAFTVPAPETTCDPTPGGTPTTRLIMSGTPNGAAGLFAWVQTAITNAADLNSNTVISGTELVSSGLVPEAVLGDAVRTALGVAGVSLPLLDALLAAGTVTMAELFALLTATLDPITSLAGQNGTYLSLPKLTMAVPGGTLAGTYRGTMTVTLVDVP